MDKIPNNPPSNKEIAKLFKLVAALMELHEESEFKIRSYNSAALTIERLDKPIAELTPAQIQKLPNIGDAITTSIEALLNQGTFDALTRLINNTPPGIIEVLNIKGLGPKKVKTLWNELGIESLGELLYACNENRLTALKGFGEKTQSNIQQNIEYLQANAHKYRYASVINEAQTLVQIFAKQSDIEKIELTGAIRRCCETIETIEMAIAAPLQAIQIACASIQININEKTRHCWKGNTQLNTPICLYITDGTVFEKSLWQTTGSQQHINQCLKYANTSFEALNANTEIKIYEQLKLPYFIPEVREGLDEVTQFAQQKTLPKFIEFNDIKGIIHAHSTYSDGKHSLEDMAKHCKTLGYQYLGISDHSQSAFYANGLKPEKIIEQHKEIDKLNQLLAPFKIFKGIEADILGNGSLDYDNDILQSFDFVIASIHSNLKMTEEKAMQRLIKAIENPYTTILGHPTGRLLLSRKGYPINYEKIIDACAANQVIIELNANPNRLDIDWRYLNYCMKKNILISINPDAHSIEAINDVQYGVLAARKGKLEHKFVFNTFLTCEIEKYFKK